MGFTALSIFPSLLFTELPALITYLMAREGLNSDVFPNYGCVFPMPFYSVSTHNKFSDWKNLRPYFFLNRSENYVNSKTISVLLCSTWQSLFCSFMAFNSLKHPFLVAGCAWSYQGMYIVRSMCLPSPSWEREVDSVTSGKKFGGREQGLPNALASFLGTVILLTACLELLLPQSGEDGRGLEARGFVGRDRVLQGVGVGRGCKAARVLFVPEVQVWL